MKRPQAKATASKKDRTPYFVISVQNSDRIGSKQNQSSSSSSSSKNSKKGISANQNIPPATALNDNKNSTANSTRSDTNGTVHVLVVAHPDDESMFFLPTITSLQQLGETVWILCLTTGNYDGLGDTRKAELSKVCRLLRIPKLIQLEMKDSTTTDKENNEGKNRTSSRGIQDHPTEAWSLDVVAAELEKALSVALRSTGIPYQKVVLITFDTDGVSGHINHRDTYLGVRNLVFQQQQQRLDLVTTTYTTQNGNSRKKNQSQPSSSKPATTSLPPLEAWKLDTVHFLPGKYLPVVGWCLCLLSFCCLWKPTCSSLPKQSTTSSTIESNNNHSTTDANSDVVHTYRSGDPLLSWKAMATHQSQFVWYRRLFVVFSCYTFVNKLRPVQ